jgi:hypothetical protein
MPLAIELISGAFAGEAAGVDCARPHSSRPTFARSTRPWSGMRCSFSAISRLAQIENHLCPCVMSGSQHSAPGWV